MGWLLKNIRSEGTIGKNRGDYMKNSVIGVLIVAILTAGAGRITFNGHTETWYNLPMQKVVERSDKAIGLTDMYWIREDGVKMYAQWVICAAHPSKIRYSRIQTSLGEGIILDTHTSKDTELIDIATTW